METTVKIIADTIGKAKARITTFELTFPRYLLAELNTHKTLAKSCASSRAIPVSKRIEMVEEHPFVPRVFGKNKPGMQSTEQLSEDEITEAREVWLESIQDAIKSARRLEKLKVHKQQANRILEPYVYVTDVVTGTEWSNFFWLRNNIAADPEFYEMAGIMEKMWNESKPKNNGFHFPYYDESMDGLSLEDIFLICGARCARTSYRTFDGKISTPEEDIALCNDKLIPSGHLSPFEHAAIADDPYFCPLRNGWYWQKPSDHRHLYGWIPHRVEIERKLGLQCKRDSHAEILDPWGKNA